MDHILRVTGLVEDCEWEASCVVEVDSAGAAGRHEVVEAVIHSWYAVVMEEVKSY